MKEEKASLAIEREKFRAQIADQKTSELGIPMGKRVAVVLSGGGARGAYEAGVLLAIQDGGIPTHILTATSIGSINAAFYAASSTTLVGNAESLVQSWLELTPPTIGIEWTRYIFMLAGFVAGVMGFGNLIRGWLHERGVTLVHLHDPTLTWLFLGLAGVSVLFLHDRLTYLWHVAQHLLRWHPWKPEKRKVVLSLFANAMVFGLIFIVFRPAHFHTRFSEVVHRHPIMTAVAFTAMIIALIYRRSLRSWASLLSHKFLRMPFRTGLFPNLERTRFLRERIDIERLRASPMRVVIAATDVDEGTERFFSNASQSALAADSGVNSAFVASEIEPAEDLMKTVIASSALPIFYEAVTLGGKLYTDGSIVVSQPIRPAICLGADVMFIVMTRPRKHKTEKIKTFLDLGLRALDIVMAQNLRKDLKILNNMNRLCEKYAAESGVRPEQVDVAIGTRIYRYLQVFTVCPDQPLGASLLDFDGKTAGQAILEGYRDGCKAVLDFLAYSAPATAKGPRHLIALALDKARRC